MTVVHPALSLEPDELRRVVEAYLEMWAVHVFDRLERCLEPRLGSAWAELLCEELDTDSLDVAAIAKTVRTPPACLPVGFFTGEQSDHGRRVLRVRNDFSHADVRLPVQVGTARSALAAIKGSTRSFGWGFADAVAAELDHLGELEASPERWLGAVVPDHADLEMAQRERDDALALVEEERAKAKAMILKHEQRIAKLEGVTDEHARDATRRLQQKLEEEAERARALAEDKRSLEAQIAALESRSTLEDVTSQAPVPPPGSANVRAAATRAGSAAERWTLSPRRRSLTRTSDGLDIGERVGPGRAVELVNTFLARRPEGGRVWIDAHGQASTLIGGRVAQLGPIIAAEPTTLEEAIARELGRAPLSTAREVARRLIDTSWNPTKSDVNSVLYRLAGTQFTMDDSPRPRWSLLGGAATTAVPARAALVPSRPAPARESDEWSKFDALLERLTRSQPSTTPPSAPPAGVELDEPLVAAIEPPAATVLALHPWQRRALDAWYANGCRGAVEAVTGTGKTHVGLEAAAQAALAGLSTTVLVPTVDLQRQWVRRFREFLPHLSIATVGGVAAGTPSRSQVTIAVVHSASRRNLAGDRPGGLLVADEMHRYGADSWSVALRDGYARRLGLTATLERADDAVETVLRPYFGRTVLAYSFANALQDEVVAPFRLLLLPVGLNEEEQGEYEAATSTISSCIRKLRALSLLNGVAGQALAQRLSQISGMGGQPARIAQAAESAMRARRTLLADLKAKTDAVGDLSPVVELSNGTVIFTQTTNTAESVAHRLRGSGVPAAALHADMDRKERENNLDALDAGHLRALSAPRLLDEGIDVPSVDLGIVTAASRSRRQMIQRLGRVIRRKSDGRAVNFVILFAQGTVEDPSDGAHEGFFDMVGDAARDVVELEEGWTVEDVFDHLELDLV
ncbi:helicase-related protein [Isoptericola sp. b490]|uniref:DEAD/DEAH box helicase family protein n=1 Tax=Actinotalea lenta TaxID=3064654 RepID=UPI0027126D88|nr:DEAD/DEAH box helicase family protein [Isoptericola sp. b490]MDO8122561.1 helicase-related protein [Isoptericola sp. b490]